MAPRRLSRRLRRAGPELVLTLVVVFAAVSFWQSWDMAAYLRREARDTSRIFGRVVAVLASPSPDESAAMLLSLNAAIRESGLPMVITGEDGVPTLTANVPYPVGDPRLLALVRELDRDNPPIEIPEVGQQIHYGALPIQQRLMWLTLLQVGILFTAVALGVWAYRTSVKRERDLLWVAMARESAHQLGTPLMSADAWVDRLAEGTTPPAEIAAHLRADLERLQRVARRFERIGRPARRDRVALGALVERVAAYFQPRLPRRAHAVTLAVRAPEAGPMISADPVLLEWAVEALVRNALDALSGRGGTIALTVQRRGRDATITVSDDGPGIPPSVRASLFEPGVSTKPGGWGIGLALARRIVEDVHRGRLDLASGGSGATFVATLPVAPDPEPDGDDA